MRTRVLGVRRRDSNRLLQRAAPYLTFTVGYLKFTVLTQLTLITCVKLVHGRLARWCRWSACDVCEATWPQGLENEQSPFRRFGYATPQMSRAPSFVSATSHLILQPFHSFASPTSHALHLRHLASRPLKLLYIKEFPQPSCLLSMYST